MATTTARTSRKSGLLGNASPAYVFDTEVFSDNIYSLAGAMKNEFGKNGYLIGYSVKTNHNPVVVSLAIDCGCYAEVVSKQEYSQMSCPKHKIIYNGIIPDAVGKYGVARSCGIVNVESLTEFKELADYCGQLESEIEVGIRLNYEQGHVSRLGIVYGGDEYKDVMRIAANNPYISVTGVHVHTCEQDGRSAKAWERKAEIIGKIAKENNFKYIDFGSKMYGPMDDRLAEQFNEHIPSYTEYAKSIKRGLKKAYGNEKLPLVIIEPGTPVVGNAMSVIANVINIRERNNHRFATVDVSIHDIGWLIKTKEVPVDVIVRNSNSTLMDTGVYGYTCTEDDVIVKRKKMAIGIGDVIAFRNLGAYTLSVANDFIMPKLPAIFI